MESELDNIVANAQAAKLKYSGQVSSLLDAKENSRLDTFKEEKPFYIGEIHEPKEVDESTLIDATDSSQVRSFTKDRVLNSLNSFVKETPKFKVTFSDVGFGKRWDKGYTSAEIEKVKKSSGSAVVPVSGVYNILNKETGDVMKSKRMKIMDVPYRTKLGVYTRSGTDYGTAQQLRLSSSIYTRKTSDDKYESQFVLDPGTGMAFRIQLDPETEKLSYKQGSRTAPLLPLLRRLGATDEEIKNTWGEKLYNVNNSARESSHASNLYTKLEDFGRKAYSRLNMGKEMPDDVNPLKYYYSNMRMDPEAVNLTMGKPYKSVSHQVMNDAVSKLVKVSNGEQEVDNRDSMAFQKVYDITDMYLENMRNDSGGVLNAAVWRAINRGEPNIKAGLFSKYVTDAFTNSGLAQVLTQVNPLETYNMSTKITRLGQGSMGVQNAPDEARAVQPSYMGFIDPVKSPESLRVGLDNYLSYKTKRGRDGFLYSPFVDAKSNKTVWLSSRQAGSSVIQFPGEDNLEDKYVPALINGSTIGYVDRDKITHKLSNGDDMFSLASNLVPLKSGVKGMRLLMGSKFSQAALPLASGEAPLVNTSLGNTTAESMMGRAAGAIYSDQDAEIVKVDKYGVTTKDSNGKLKTYEMFNHYPFATKTELNNTAMVKVGDKIKPGQLIAKSNFTDDKGVLNVGRNVSVAYRSTGNNYEDALEISESMAKKMAAVRSYPVKKKKTGSMKFNKKTFNTLFPGEFSKDQWKNIDENGMVKPGVTLNYGDPIYLAVETRKADPATGLASKITNISQIWDHHFPGYVVDMSNNQDNSIAYIQATVPMEVGDKLGIPYGGKGVVSNIIPDAQMPKDEEGKPIDIFMSNNGIISRTNPAQMAAASLAKVAAKTGKPYNLSGFSSDNIIKFAMSELEKNGFNKDGLEDMYDPRIDKTISDTFIGNMYVYNQVQTSDSKGKSRSTAGYTSDGQPSRGGKTGAKHLGGMEIRALLSHDAQNVLKDTKLIRGQKNTEYMNDFKNGRITYAPDTPLVYKKFKALVGSAGVLLTEEKNGDDSIYAMTNKDAEGLTGKRKIENFNTFRADKLEEPIKGGLFDKSITGYGSDIDRWSYIELPVPILNPVVKPSILSMLGMTGKAFDEKTSGMSNAEVQKMIADIDPVKVMNEAKKDATSNSISKRNEAVKRIRFADSMIKNNVLPKDFMMTRVPVLPPRYRPIIDSDGMVMIDDMNYMYKDLIHKVDAYRDAMNTPDKELQQIAYKEMATAYGAVLGSNKTQNSKLEQKNVGGALFQLFGKGNVKKSFIQRKLYDTNTDLSSLNVITPDKSLSLDEIGLPKKHAVELFKPILIRSLRLKGYTAKKALSMVENDDKALYPVLEEILEEYPVIANRAPTLHKQSMMAFKGRLTAGDSLRVSPNVVGPFGADFDGNCVDFDTRINIRISKSALKDKQWIDYLGVSAVRDSIK